MYASMHVCMCIHACMHDKLQVICKNICTHNIIQYTKQPMYIYIYNIVYIYIYISRHNARIRLAGGMDRISECLDEQLCQMNHWVIISPCSSASFFEELRALLQETLYNMEFKTTRGFHREQFG